MCWNCVGAYYIYIYIYMSLMVIAVSSEIANALFQLITTCFSSKLYITVKNKGNLYTVMHGVKC